MKRSPSSHLWWLTYPLWLAICVVLFLVTRGMDDPSRPSHRLESDEAAELAIVHLQRAIPGRFSEYEVVHVARASGESGEGEPRWMVLADHQQRTRLERAVLIELALVDGALLDIRSVDASTASSGQSILPLSGGATP